MALKKPDLLTSDRDLQRDKPAHHANAQECLPNCGACCIAPGISSPIPGMPHGKPAGMRCIHLTIDSRCKLFGKPERPNVCADFLPTSDVCAGGPQEAMRVLKALERLTNPDN